MPTTSNFGWTTPADTDLVKDGASAIRTLGNGIDTSMADLKGGTTGQILSKNSNTDMDFTWIANDVGDITNVAVSSPITGGGSSGSVTIGIEDATTSQKGAVQLTDSTSSTSTTTAATPNSVKSSYDLANSAIPKSTVTTNGDLIYGTGSATITRLGIGSTGNVLTVSGGVPTWAAPASSGGYTSLASGSLSGSSLSLTMISGSYKDLILRLVNYYGSSDADITVTVNNTTGIYYLTSSPDTYNVNLNSTNFNITRNGQDGSDGDNFVDLKILDYANTTSNKIMESTYVFLNVGGSSSSYNLGQAWIAAKLTSAINRIDLTLSAGTFSAGTYVLYGVS